MTSALFSGDAADAWALRAATEALTFFKNEERTQVDGAAFDALLAIMGEQDEHHDQLYRATGLYARHPDGAAPELQRRIGWSLFAQAWIPLLDEERARALAQRAGLSHEVMSAHGNPGEPAACGSCGAQVPVADEGRSMVCESCFAKLDLTRAFDCPQCGAGCAPREGDPRLSCAHCGAAASPLTFGET